MTLRYSSAYFKYGILINLRALKKRFIDVREYQSNSYRELAFP